MNKTEKLIVAFLLANIALAGALHLLSPIAHVPEIQITDAEIPVASNAPLRAAVVNAMSDDFVPDSFEKFRDWAARDSEAALNWAAEQPESDKRNEMLELACEQIAQNDPARAVMLADNLGLTNGTLMNLEQQWAQNDLPAARDWAVARPAGDKKNELLERVGYVWSASQPAAAADFVVQEIPPGPAQTEAAISVLHQWALRDFDGAKAWVELFPDGEIRERAVNELAGVREYTLANGAQMPSSGESSPRQ